MIKNYIPNLPFIKGGLGGFMIKNYIPNLPFIKGGLGGFMK
jgi:hypothetical protein